MTKPFDSRKYRLQNQRYGVVARWWKATPCECIDPATGQSTGDCQLCEQDGRRYSEQTLPAGEDNQPARVLVYESRGEIQTTEFDALPVGTSMISLFPDLMPVARLDRFALPGRWEAQRQVIKRGSSDFDKLAFGPVAGIARIAQNDGIIASANYRVNSELASARIEWTGATRPAEGTNYSVEYHAYTPYYAAYRVKTYGMGSDGRPLQDEWALSMKPVEA